ncbi:hypothetical protein D3C80_1460170 [compost metagenome]
MNADDFFCTWMPWFCTAEGSWGRARLTRFCTSTWARDGSVPISKNTLRVMLPVAELDEFM